MRRFVHAAELHGYAYTSKLRTVARIVIGQTRDQWRIPAQNRRRRDRSTSAQWKKKSFLVKVSSRIRNSLKVFFIALHFMG